MACMTPVKDQNALSYPTSEIHTQEKDMLMQASGLNCFAKGRSCAVGRVLKGIWMMSKGIWMRLLIGCWFNEGANWRQ